MGKDVSYIMDELCGGEIGLFTLGLVGFPEGYLRDIAVGIIVHDGAEEVLGAFGFGVCEDQL